MHASSYLSMRFMRRILSRDNSNDSLVSCLLLTWTTSHILERCRIPQHQVKVQPAFVPQLVCPVDFPWESLSVSDNLGQVIAEGCPGVAVCLVKHSVTSRNSFAAVRPFSKGRIVSFIDPRLPSMLDTTHPCRDVVFVSDRETCSFCKATSTPPTPSMQFVGKGCAQLLLCSPAQGVNTELLSVGQFVMSFNGSTSTHTLVVARTTAFVAPGEIFVMNCAYQCDNDTTTLASLDSTTLPRQSTHSHTVSSVRREPKLHSSTLPIAREPKNQSARRKKLPSPNKPISHQQDADDCNDGGSSSQPSTTKRKSGAPRSSVNVWFRSDFSNDFLAMKYITSNAPTRPFLWPDDIMAIHTRGSPFDIRTRTMPVFHFDFDVAASSSFDNLMVLFQTQNTVQWSYSGSPSTLTDTDNGSWTSTATNPNLVTKVARSPVSNFSLVSSVEPSQLKRKK